MITRALLTTGLATLLLSASVGCTHGSTYATVGSTTPIMLGPVRTLGTLLPHGDALYGFETEVIDMRSAASNTTQQGGYVTTTTSSAFLHEDASKFDLAMQDALTRYPSCSLRTQRLKVGAYFFFAVTAIIDKSWASALTTVHGRGGEQR